MCVCVCVCVSILTYLHVHTHTHTHKECILLNTKNIYFLFCQDVMQLGRGLQITPSRMTPSEFMLEAILSFPIPNFTGSQH